MSVEGETWVACVLGCVETVVCMEGDGVSCVCICVYEESEVECVKLQMWTWVSVWIDGYMYVRVCVWRELGMCLEIWLCGCLSVCRYGRVSVEILGE